MCPNKVHVDDDAVEAHSCDNIVTTFTDEQYTTINQSTTGRFTRRVFVNCLQVEGKLTKTLGLKRSGITD